MFGILVQAQRVMQDRQRDFVAAQGALERIAIDLFDQFAPADDQPRLH